MRKLHTSLLTIMFLLFLITPLATSSSNYILTFGTGKYVAIPSSPSLENLTAITIVAFVEVDGPGTIISWGPLTDTEAHTKLRVTSAYALAFSVSNGSIYSVETFNIQNITQKKWYLIIAEADTTSGTVRVTINNRTELTSTTSVNIIEAEYQGNKYIGTLDNTTDFFEGRIGLILIYNRTLTNTEREELFADPLNPPTSGLVLWYAPDSVDTTTNTWIDKSNSSINGTIYSATPELSTFPKLYLYDASTLQSLPLGNATVEYTVNSSTITALPTLIAVPYNISVLLNISYPNYWPRNLTATFLDNPSLTVYLAKKEVIIANFTTLENVTLPTLNVSKAFEEANLSDSILRIFTKWVGGDYLVDLLKLNLKQMIVDFFNSPPLPGLGIVAAMSIWGFGIIGAWVYFKEPEPVFGFGNILYFGLSEFLYFNPGILLAPLGVFIIFVAAKWILKLLEVFGKR